MKKCLCSLILVCLFLFVGVAMVANAGTDESRFGGIIRTELLNRNLYFNAGTVSTTGMALTVSPEIVDKETGFYGNVFLTVPLRDDLGKEEDTRLGRRFRKYGMDVDASLAHFTFSAGPGSGNIVTIGNSRLRVSRTFSVTNNISVQPYGYADYQRNFSLGADAVGFAGGVSTNTKLGWFPGQPYFTVDLSSWYFPSIWTPKNGPLLTLDSQLTFRHGRLLWGPRFMQTWGSVVSSGENNCMYGAFSTVTF